jgi:hypothetical protein
MLVPDWKSMPDSALIRETVKSFAFGTIAHYDEATRSLSATVVAPVRQFEQSNSDSLFPALFSDEFQFPANIIIHVFEEILQLPFTST